MTPTHGGRHFQMKLMNMAHQLLTTMVKLQDHPPQVRMWHCLLNSWYCPETADHISGAYAQGDKQTRQHLTKAPFQSKIHLSPCIRLLQAHIMVCEPTMLQDLPADLKALSKGKWAKLHFCDSTKQVTKPQSKSPSSQLLVCTCIHA